jgi:hypothetical protein
MRLSWSVDRFLVLLFLACGPGMTISGTTPVVSTAPLSLADGTKATAQTAKVMSPTQLGQVDGKPAAATAGAVFLLSGTGEAQPTAVGETGSTTVMNGLKSLDLRLGSAFAVSSDGLFHYLSKRWLKSPLSLPGLRAVSSSGQGNSEDVWLLDDQGLKLWQREAIREVSFTFPAVPEFKQPASVVALGNGRALVSGAGQLLLVDTSQSTVEWLAKDIGNANDTLRSTSGEVILATSTGLVRYAEPKTVTFLTSEKSVTSVTQAGEAIYAMVGNDIVSLSGSTATKVAQVTAPAARGLLGDGADRLWAIDGQQLQRFQFSPPVSFEASVKPFVTAKCQTCHNGAYAPLQRFDTFAVSKARAEEIIHRLKNDDARFSIMPPASAGTLSQSDYAVFIRWVEGGFAP